jgi:hypothetical protein
LSETLPPARCNPAFPDAIRQFRQDIGGSSALPRPSRTLPRLTLKPSYRRELAIVLCLLILVAAGIGIAPLLTGSDAVPAELVGSWTTDHPGYYGRHLELTPDALIVRASVREAMEYAVRRVDRRQIPQGSAYIISAHSERGGDYTLLLEYHKAENTIAVGKPVRVLWRRER